MNATRDPLQDVPPATLGNVTNEPSNSGPSNPVSTGETQNRPNVPSGDDSDSEGGEWLMVAIDKSCDQIRRRFNNLVDCGEYTITRLSSELGVSTKSYRTFMTQKGQKGSGSDTYSAGLRFFQKRESMGIKEPRKNKRTAAEIAAAATAAPIAAATANASTAESGTTSPGEAGASTIEAMAAPAKKPRKTPANKEDTSGVEDVSDIHLEGEEEDKVPVYDTCDEIRKKMAAYLRKEGVTQAAFLRALHAELNGRKKCSRLQSSQLARFRQMKGANSGNTSAIFYAAYVYFEKVRVKQGKPKSKHREEMESIWASSGGFDIDTPSSRG